MTIVHLTAISFLTAAVWYQKRKNETIKWINKKTLYILVLTAFVVRAVIAVLNKGFPSDMACFYSWANMAYKDGLGNFYTSGAFADYPPGYIYILYVQGFLLSVLKADYMSGICLLILKLPAILCDIATGVLIYKAAQKEQSESRTLMIAAFYLLNPAVILNSCVWGQVDAVMGFMLLLMCSLLIDRKMIPSYLVYGVGVLLKPQMLIFTPVLIYGIIVNVILEDFDRHNFFYNLFGGISVIFGMILACVPFGLQNIIGLYVKTLGSYPYVSVNAYNFWAFLGKNWVPQEEKLLFLSYQHWGTMIIFAIVAVSAFFFFRAGKKKSRYFTTGAVLIISMFLFSVRMHERYLFPAMALLLAAYAVRPRKGFFFSYLAVTLAQLYNTADVLFLYSKDGYSSSAGMVRLISAGTVLAGLYFYYMLYRGDIKMAGKKTLGPEEEKQKAAGKKRKENVEKKQEKRRMPVTWKDVAVMSAVMLFYGIFAIYNLGDSVAPQTEYRMQQGETLTLKVPEDQSVSWFYWYLGNFENRDFLAEVQTAADREWKKLGDDGTITMYDVFKWDRVQLPEECRYLRLTCQSDQASIMEFAFADENEKVILPENAQDYPTLFDENEMFPADGISFLNGTYFDEIYHARTGYEFVHGLHTYETTHPPFGKILIALGIALFGMTPFGWRIAGTVIGILMIPVIYLFGREISKSRWLGTFAAVLLAFDFMHFTQTRIATIDVYVTFFILLMYYFMYRYTQMDIFHMPLKKIWLPLGACGVTMGFAVASKWTGAYGGVGLAVIFFASLFLRYREAVPANRGRFKEYTVKTIVFCLIFFVAVPGLIYVLSYIPFKSWNGGLFRKMWNNQISMFSYHSGLVAEHPFSSAWYEWPVMIRPILYYSQAVGETARQSISAFGNPLVWWTGIPAFGYMIYLAVRKKDRNAAFLCVGYLAQYLPWCMVTRITFIYHYFPSVPFVVLMLTYSAKKLGEWLPEKVWRLVTAGYAAAVVMMFLLFYPVLSGQIVNTKYVDLFLRWMDSWVL